MRLRFLPIHLFCETPQVSFFDIGVTGSNGTDVVMHSGFSMSPPDDGEFEQYYVHHHQVDHNLVLQGMRTFTLLNPAWSHPHHIVHLERVMGALQIPPGTYQRATSGPEGCLMLNQPIRDPEFEYAAEFTPVSLRYLQDLREAKLVRPWIWSWQDGHIRRHDGDGEPSQSRGRRVIHIRRPPDET
jgi:hypothetical protein